MPPRPSSRSRCRSPTVVRDGSSAGAPAGSSRSMGRSRSLTGSSAGNAAGSAAPDSPAARKRSIASSRLRMRDSRSGGMARDHSEGGARGTSSPRRFGAQAPLATGDPGRRPAARAAAGNPLFGRRRHGTCPSGVATAPFGPVRAQSFQTAMKNMKTNRHLTGLVAAAAFLAVPLAAQIVAYHDASSATHQAQFANLAGSGYRMIALTIYGTTQNPQYAAVWVHRPGPPFVGFHDTTSAAY